MRVPSTKESRLKLSGEVIYRKNELFRINFLIDNKIIKKHLITGTILREKLADNVIPTYRLDAEYDSDITDMAGFLKVNVLPEGRDIKTVLTLETNKRKSTQTPFRLVDLQGTLTHKKTDEDIDYSVDLKYSSFRKTSVSVNGDVSLSLFKSNLDLSLGVSSQRFSLPSPVLIKAGHGYDGAKGAKSFIKASLNVPATSINHGVKVLAGLDGFSLESVEIQVKTPSTSEKKPMSVSIAKSSAGDITEIQILFDNFNIDLSTRKSPLAQALIKADENNVLYALLVKVRREKSQDGKKNSVRIELEKNSKAMVRLGLNTDLKVDLVKLVGNAKELPRQEASVAFDMKLLEYTGWDFNFYFVFEEKNVFNSPASLGETPLCYNMRFKLKLCQKDTFFTQKYA